MSKTMTIVYYDGEDTSTVWVSTLPYDYSTARELEKYGIVTKANMVVMKRSTLEAYTKKSGFRMKSIGKLTTEPDVGTRIIRYDDGNPKTPTEERLAHTVSRVVVASDRMTYDYMVLHASEHGLLVKRGGPESIINKDYSITFVEGPAYSLRQLIEGVDIPSARIEVDEMVAESYEDIEKKIAGLFEEAKDKISALTTHTRQDDANEESELEPDTSVDIPMEAIAILSLDTDGGRIIGNITLPVKEWWQSRRQVTGASLLDAKGHVIAEGNQDQSAGWNSALTDDYDFANADKTVLDAAVTYRLHLTSQEKSAYHLDKPDDFLPATIDADKYDSLPDFMKGKYSLGKMKDVTSHQDYTIVAKTINNVPIIVAATPRSASLGIMIKRALGYDNDQPVRNHENLGSVIVHDMYSITGLKEPYNGKTRPKYSTDRRRRRPTGYAPVYGEKAWKIRYDSPAWPMVYGRSYDELLEQAKDVLANFEHDNENGEQ
jgi:hypothetical protein